MIHFHALAADSEPLFEQSELLARFAGLKRALELVEPFGAGPASDVEDGLDGAMIATAGAPARRCFDRRSEQLVAAAAAGLEAVVAERGAGQELADAALAVLAEEIRAGLADLSSLVRN
jgi:hypothetical protein